MLSKCITILVRWFIIVTNSSEAYTPVCNIKIKWIYEFTFINHCDNVLDASICKRDFIFVFVFTLNGINMIFQKMFHCADVACIIFVFVFTLNGINMIFQKNFFSVLMLLVLLTWICRPISFFSNLLHSALNFESLFIVQSIQKSGDKEEYTFPVYFQQ